MSGVFHGAGLVAMDQRHGGSIIDAQIVRALADAPWSEDLLSDVAAVRCEDFDLLDCGPLPGSLRSCPPAERDIDDSLDLVAIAVRA
jgi:hypothetical protein